MSLSGSFNCRHQGDLIVAEQSFLRWCEGRGITSLGEVLPVHVAAYIEQLQGRLAAPTVKQHLACIRMLFDWLVTGQVVPSNPAHSVRGPRHSVSKGITPVLSSEEATASAAVLLMRELKRR